MYIFSRMVLGFGIVFCIISGSSLIGELGHPKDRATLTSLFNASYFFGQITASAIALGTTDIPSDWSWRLPSLLQMCPSFLQIIFVFLLPESPRWLISRDRYDEAHAILIKYHAEGDASSVLVKAEIAQIKETIQIEIGNSKQSWLDMVRTSGMRRRVLISAFLGLFTQMSGNSLLSYYQNLLYEMMGYTTTYAKTRINLANACWSLLGASVAAFVVARFKRRHMFMLSAASMCLVFTAMTISFERLSYAKEHNFKNKSAGIAALFFYFAYSPCYNIGNNALTYSKPLPSFNYLQSKSNITLSLPCRTLPLLSPYPRHRYRANLRQDRRFLLQQREPRSAHRHRLEISRYLLRLDLLRVLLHLLHVSRDGWAYPGGIGVLV